MHLKRYQRQTVQEALRAVREDLGPDALVLSTRLVPAPGPRGWLGRRVVELTAAADRPQVPEARQARPEDDPARVPGRVVAMPAPEVRARARARAGRPGGDHQGVHGIAARLRAAGVDADLAREVAVAYPQAHRRGVSTRALFATLAEHLAPLAARDEQYAPVEVFVGPPGVGKTTTIAKIAAQARARQGQRLGLIAADGVRVGAVEQLRLYAHLLDAPLGVARTPYELMTALDTAAGPVLLDTAGRSPADGASRDLFRVIAARPNARIHLVVGADIHPAAMEKVFERYDAVQPTRLVLTKLDEAGSLAPLVPCLRARRIPVSYLATGPHVPDDLQTATPDLLAAWVAGDVPAQGATA